MPPQTFHKLKISTMMHFRLFAILLLLVAGSTTVVSGQTQQEPALDMEFTDIPL